MPEGIGSGEVSSVGPSSGAESVSSVHLDSGSTTTESAGGSTTTAPPVAPKPKLGTKPLAPKNGTTTPVDEFKFKDKFKLNGKEEEREFDREQTRRLAQLGLAQDEGFAKIKSERAQLAKEKEELARIVRGAKNDPDAVLKLFGLDPDEYAAKKLERHYELQQMTPEQRRARELEETLREREARLATYEKEKETRSAKEQEDRAWAEYQPKALKAAEEFGLPSEPWVMDQLASIGEEFLEAELDLDPREHVRELDKRLRDNASRHIKSLDVGGLKKLLGPEKLKALIQDSVEAAKKSSFDRMQSDEEPVVRREEEPPDEGVSEEDFMAILHGKKPRKLAGR